MGNVSILRASAGSGKTYRLVREYIGALVEDPASYRHILAVTFTNKATEEMKERIVRELHALASGAPSPYLEGFMERFRLTEVQVRERALRARTHILHDYSRFSILTIDKFFQNIIRAFLRELGISLDFTIELQTGTLLEGAADALVERSERDPALKAWLGGFLEEQMEESGGWDVRGKLARTGREIFGESWDFEEAASREGLREALGAAVQAAVAERDRAVARMQAAAREAMAVIARCGLTVDDFAYRRSGIAGYFERTAEGELIDYRGKAYIMRAVESDEGWFAKKSPAEMPIRAAIPLLRPHLDTICGLWDENHRLFHSVRLLRKRYRSVGLLDDITREVLHLCMRQNIMPIARTNHILHRLIAGNDTPFIFEKAGNHYSRFLIDEFQDTSRRQWENFVPLLQNAMAQSDGTPVLLVGDIKQSIYRWRGGDWQILSGDAAATLGGALPEALDTNRRSLERVVTFNNNAIGACVARDSLELQHILVEARDGGYLSPEACDRLTGMLPAAYEDHAQQPVPEKAGGYVTLTLRGEEQEDEDALPATDPVIARIEELQARGCAPGDILILVRRNEEARRIARQLLDHKAAHPDSPYIYDMVTSEALQIGSSPAVEFAVACLAIAADRRDAVARAIWNRYRERPFHEALPAEEEAFLGTLALLPPVEALQKALLRYDLAARTSELAYVQALHEQAVLFCARNVADLPLFLRWWQETGRTETLYMPASRSAIGIITIHAAKGLERKAVLIPYCSWPLAPKSGSTFWVDCADTPFEGVGRTAIGFEKSVAQSHFSEAYYEELVMAHIDNINLLYVALTRAREELHLYIPRRKGKAKDTSVSTVGDLLSGALDASGESARLGGIEGRTTRRDDTLAVTEFGTPALYAGPAPGANKAIATGYPSRDPGVRVRLRLPSRRYFEDEAASPALSPRSYGVLMHKVFENAETAADLQRALAALRSDGALSAAEAANVEQLVARALEDGCIASWFSGEWERVRNEHDIIVPHGGGRRPDRVMVRRGQAVVVDYKFGARELPAHRTQIEQYKQLLLQMGYRQVEGYLWYVSEGRVVEV